MNPRATKLRRALRAAADALADFIEAEAAQPEAVEAPAPDLPNHDVARAFATAQIRRRGWAAPKAVRGR